jgi:hypothetical protein
MHRSLWFKALVAVASIWLIVGAITWLARAAKPTPESIARYVSEHSLGGKSPADRGKIVSKVADQLNGLGYDDRRGIRTGKTLDGFYRSLTPEEQGRFLDLTLPAGFNQMMDAFNKMDPVKRKEFVERALADMKSHEGEAAPQNNDPNVQKFIQQGVKSFYSEASADVKMDLSPLIEQMQRNMQSFR